jgi:hypothetical protein
MVVKKHISTYTLSLIVVWRRWKEVLRFWQARFLRQVQRPQVLGNLHLSTCNPIALLLTPTLVE